MTLVFYFKNRFILEVGLFLFVFSEGNFINLFDKFTKVVILINVLISVTIYIYNVNGIS